MDIRSDDTPAFLYAFANALAMRNIYITSFGRNVAPEWAEQEIAQQPGIRHVMVVGEARPYAVALVSAPQPDVDAATIDRAVAAANSRLPDYAQVRRELVELARGADDAFLQGRHGRIADLEAVLTRLPPVNDPAVISGLAAADDAAIYRIADNLCLVQTVDVFTPCVDDPHLFGRICAANCLSDIYAMGGEPRTALSMVPSVLMTISCWPSSRSSWCMPSSGRSS